MLDLFPNVTTDIVDNSDWINLSEKSAKNSAFHLSFVFSAAVKDAKTSTNESLSEFYNLLEQVFSMCCKADDPKDPFTPMWEMNGSRSAIVTDFSESNLDIFAYLVGKAKNPLIDARLSDVLWLRRKNRLNAEKAIESYLAHAQDQLKFDGDGWLYGLSSLERACQLWTGLGRVSAFSASFQTLLRGCLDKSDPEPQNYFRVKVLQVSAKYGLETDPGSMQQWTEQLAEHQLNEKHFEKARAYLAISSEFAQQNKDRSNLVRVKRKLVDCFVYEARSLKSSGADGMLLAGLYSKAIESARRHGGLRSLINDLHVEMNEAQEKALSELKSFEFKVDVTQYVNMGRDAVISVPIEETLSQIARLTAPVTVQNLRMMVVDTAKASPLLHLITGVTYSSNGRVVARTAPALATDETEREAGIQAQMIAEAGRQQDLLGRSLLQSARLALEERLPAGIPLFEDLIEQNPFVPEGRQGLYLKGLKAGLHGDFISCAHHLIPQLENSIRNYMELSGKLVTRLKEDMTQKELDLNVLLYDPCVKDIFGEDLIYTLRVLLVEELGGNFRNRLAHGLLSEGHFNSGWVNYLWAITIRLLWLARLAMKKWNQDNQT
jgi:hypothetical protein